MGVRSIIGSLVAVRGSRRGAVELRISGDDSERACARPARAVCGGARGHECLDDRPRKCRADDEFARTCGGNVSHSTAAAHAKLSSRTGNAARRTQDAVRPSVSVTRERGPAARAEHSRLWLR
jgi:hypothetical protein